MALHNNGHALLEVKMETVMTWLAGMIAGAVLTGITLGRLLVQERARAATYKAAGQALLYFAGDARRIFIKYAEVLEASGAKDSPDKLTRKVVPIIDHWIEKFNECEKKYGETLGQTPDYTDLGPKLR